MNDYKLPTSGFLDSSINEMTSKTQRVLISKKLITEDGLRRARLYDLMDGNTEHWGLKAGQKITRLIVDKQIMMSDTIMEFRTNSEFISKANGHVLIAGLGLGIIVHLIQDFDSIKTITVIEKDADVLEVVLPQMKFNEKVNIIHGDIFDYEVPVGVKFDTLYFDIWPTISGDNWEDMKALTKKFKYKINRTNPNWWRGHWREYDVKRLVAEGKRWERRGYW